MMDLIAKLMVPHVHGLGAVWGDRFIYDTECRCVVSRHLCQGLMVSHHDEGVLGRGCFVEIDVERYEFRLGGGLHDGFYHLGDCAYGLVDGGSPNFQEEMAAGAAL